MGERDLCSQCRDYGVCEFLIYSEIYNLIQIHINRFFIFSSRVSKSTSILFETSFICRWCARRCPWCPSSSCKTCRRFNGMTVLDSFGAEAPRLSWKKHDENGMYWKPSGVWKNMLFFLAPWDETKQATYHSLKHSWIFERKFREIPRNSGDLVSMRESERLRETGYTNPSPTTSYLVMNNRGMFWFTSLGLCTWVAGPHASIL